MSRTLVLELNEVPPRVLRWWGETTPNSALWALAQSGRFVDTVLDETLPRDLYPSQSWASVGMGSPWVEHNVFWYGDPKPSDSPRFYWQRAAEADKTVGLVGVLHTSPVPTQCEGDAFRFVIPDVFSGDSTTIPSQLRPLQELNLRMTRRSARVASTSFGLDDVAAAAHFARHGVRATTFAELGALATAVATRRWNKERLRVGQALLMADVFERLVRRHDTDLSVLFSNHVASAMHRYWAATFPEDFDAHPYGDQWIADHRDELPYAMRATDKIVSRLSKLASSTNRELIIISSMGQRADLDVRSATRTQIVIRDPRRLLDSLECPFPNIEVRPAMVPQLTFTLPDPDTAQAFTTWISDQLSSAVEETMIADATVTLTCNFGESDTITTAHGVITVEAAGATIETITDHRSGRHDPRGILVSNRRTQWDDEVDALHVHRLILERLGVPASLNMS